MTNIHKNRTLTYNLQQKMGNRGIWKWQYIKQNLKCTSSLRQWFIFLQSMFYLIHTLVAVNVNVSQTNTNVDLLIFFIEIIISPLKI